MKPKYVDPVADCKLLAMVIKGKEVNAGDLVAVNKVSEKLVFRFIWIPDGSVAWFDPSTGKYRNFRATDVRLPKVKRNRRQLL